MLRETIEIYLWHYKVPMSSEAFETCSLGPRNTEPTSKFNIEAFGYTFTFPTILHLVKLEWPFSPFFFFLICPTGNQFCLDKFRQCLQRFLRTDNIKKWYIDLESVEEPGSKLCSKHTVNTKGWKRSTIVHRI